MKITHVEVQDVLKIQYLEVDPQDGVTIIGGNNAQGKSSFMDAVSAAIGGKKLCPAKPIRKGASRGRVEVHVDGGHHILPHPCKIIREFWKNEKDELRSKVEIVSEDGYKAPTPQGILDAIVTHATFDPLAFSRLRPKEQADQLKELVGLDFDELDRSRHKLYNERTLVNREVQRIGHQLDQMPHYPEARRVDVSSLVNQIDEISEQNGDVTKAQRDLAAAEKAVETEQLKQVASEKELEKLAAELERRREAHAKYAIRTADHVERLALLKEQIEAMEIVDSEPIRQQLKESAEANEQFEKNKARKQLQQQKTERQNEASDLGRKIQEIDDNKTRMQSEAAWPVDGLGFDSGGVTFGDLPFDQASSAEQMAVSVAMGAALNPTLPLMLIRDGSLLDEERLAEIGRLATENKCQLFVERVGEGSECHVVLEDGLAKGADAEVEEVTTK